MDLLTCLYERFSHIPAPYMRCLTGVVMISLILLQVRYIHYSAKEEIPDVRLRPCSLATRRQHMLHTCRVNGWSGQVNTSNPNVFWRLLVDDQQHLLYCVIPKVACTSFKTFIVNSSLEEPKDTIPVHKIKFLNSVGFQYLSQSLKIKARLQHYRKFLAVRHPFDRLVSAHQEKFLEKNVYPRRFEHLFKRIFGGKLTYDEFGFMRPTLAQFAEIVARYYDIGFVDRHWQTYFDLCHPCDVRYDEVLKLETLPDDIESFTKRYDKSKVDAELTFPTYNMERDNQMNKMVATAQKFSQIGPAIIERLLDIYHKDFKLFGYTWSPKEGATCQVNQNTDNECC